MQLHFKTVGMFETKPFSIHFVDLFEDKLLLQLCVRKMYSSIVFFSPCNFFLLEFILRAEGKAKGRHSNKIHVLVVKDAKQYDCQRNKTLMHHLGDPAKQTKMPNEINQINRRTLSRFSVKGFRFISNFHSNVIKPVSQSPSPSQCGAWVFEPSKLAGLNRR